MVRFYAVTFAILCFAVAYLLSGKRTRIMDIIAAMVVVSGLSWVALVVTADPIFNTIRGASAAVGAALLIAAGIAKAVRNPRRGDRVRLTVGLTLLVVIGVTVALLVWLDGS